MMPKPTTNWILFCCSPPYFLLIHIVVSKPNTQIQPMDVATSIFVSCPFSDIHKAKVQNITRGYGHLLHWSTLWYPYITPKKNQWVWPPLSFSIVNIMVSMSNPQIQAVGLVTFIFVSGVATFVFVVVSLALSIPNIQTQPMDSAIFLASMIIVTLRIIMVGVWWWKCMCECICGALLVNIFQEGKHG